MSKLAHKKKTMFTGRQTSQLLFSAPYELACPFFAREPGRKQVVEGTTRNAQLHDSSGSLHCVCASQTKNVRPKFLQTKPPRNAQFSILYLALPEFDGRSATPCSSISKETMTQPEDKKKLCSLRSIQRETECACVHKRKT